jgi:hypothetical protein
VKPDGLMPASENVKTVAFGGYLQYQLPVRNPLGQVRTDSARSSASRQLAGLVTILERLADNSWDGPVGKGAVNIAVTGQ